MPNGQYRPIEVVVAKYNEDISWVCQLVNDVWITVYDKSEDPLFGTIPLPNVGREANTYLEHIVRRYDTLSEYTVFTQGKISDHCPLLVHDVLLIPEWYRDFVFLGNELKIDSASGYPNGWMVGYHEFDFIIDEFFMEVFETDRAPGFYPYAEGAVFGVGKPLIMNRPREFYQRLLRIGMEDKRYNGNVFPHGFPWLMERIWAYVFKKELSW